MSKTTSVTIDGRFETFINDRVASGQFASANEVVQAALSRFEEDELKRERLNEALREGVESGFVENFDRNEFLAELHRQYLAKQ
ncbi:MAG: type II toxin-antitoxin system ParD family antitoxin [Blastocatellia bacterium]|jgi:antitoxin ParD1/3/4|nr:type II toxin-antitoxin system ParD family antitoxin [Blastocatellia bacterium]